MVFHSREIGRKFLFQYNTMEIFNGRKEIWGIRVGFSVIINLSDINFFFFFNITFVHYSFRNSIRHCRNYLKKKKKKEKRKKKDLEFDLVCTDISCIYIHIIK